MVSFPCAVCHCESIVLDVPLDPAINKHRLWQAPEHGFTWPHADQIQRNPVSQRERERWAAVATQVNGFVRWGELVCAEAFYWQHVACCWLSWTGDWGLPLPVTPLPLRGTHWERQREGRAGGHVWGFCNVKTGGLSGPRADEPLLFILSPRHQAHWTGF